MTFFNLWIDELIVDDILSINNLWIVELIVYDTLSLWIDMNWWTQIATMVVLGGISSRYHSTIMVWWVCSMQYMIASHGIVNKQLRAFMNIAKGTPSVSNYSLFDLQLNRH